MSATPAASDNTAKSRAVSQKLYCTHCGLPVPAFLAQGKSAEDAVFCCEGCRTVYQIITGCSLEQYYAIKKQSAFFAPAQAASSVYARYGYLDDDAVRQRFAYGENFRTMDFYIEGVHCVACLWLIERLGVLVPDIDHVQMNLGSLVAKVTLGEKGSFAAAAEGIERLGYRPHPLCEGKQEGDLRRGENQSDLLRIGVAGFCMMNIMILFISIYAGVSESLLAFFRWLSGALFIPVALYSAMPFYRGAFAALRARQMHIDIPVAGAIFLGSAASLVNLISGSEHIYFDSLSAFVFLLLSARYLLKTIHQKTASQIGPGEFLVPKTALHFDAGKRTSEPVAVQKINPGDLVLVPQGEVIAVDGEVFEGSGYADFHMISGESEPVRLLPGALVYAGTTNVGPELIVRAGAVGFQTRIERLLQSVSRLEKPKTVQAADLAARRYMWAVGAGAVVLAFFCRGLSFAESFDRALSLIIIACPCALALATPLAYRLAWRECSASGVILKEASALDKLAHAKTLFLDKTGTLTFGRFEVLEWKKVSGENDMAAEAYALEKRSNHPIALAIRNHALGLNPAASDSVEVNAFEEKLGWGVKGIVSKRNIEIRGIEDNEFSTGAIRSTVGVFENGDLKVKIRLGDRIREDSKEALENLRTQFDSIHVISGDKQAPVQAVAAELQIASVFFEASPEQKKETLQSEPFSLMVGDGANDAAAMKAASVAIAVQGSIEASFQCAEAYLVRPGIGGLANLVAIARRTRNVVKLTLIISLGYNLAGMILAIAGWVTPLIAAVAMPLSSFTVLAVSYAGLKTRRK